MELILNDDNNDDNGKLFFVCKYLNPLFLTFYFLLIHFGNIFNIKLGLIYINEKISNILKKILI